MNLHTVILAAGKGKRMKTDLPKVLLPIHGVTMIERVILAAKELKPKKIILVIGYKGEIVQEVTKHLNVEYVWQREQLGTGHAVLQTKQFFKTDDGCLLVLYGDTPLVKSVTLAKLYKSHLSEKSSATVLTACIDKPFGYGRIIRNSQGHVLRIVEEKEATPLEKKIKEINSGMYIFKVSDLFNALKKINNQNVQQEYFLPDVIRVLISEGKKVNTYMLENHKEILGANTKEQLNVLSESIL